MDSRGIPIVIPVSKFSSPRRNTKHTTLRNEIPSSPFIMPSLKNEQSLLELYDSFADACFQSHYNHSMLNDDGRYNVLEFYKSEICPSDNTPAEQPFPSTIIQHNQITTFESKVPELQASRESPCKMHSSILSEETGPFETHFLEYAPIKVTPKTVNEPTKELMSTTSTSTTTIMNNNDTPTDHQLIGFSDIVIGSTQGQDMTMLTADSCLNSTCQTSALHQKDGEELDNTHSLNPPAIGMSDIQHISPNSSLPKKRKTIPESLLRRSTRNKNKEIKKETTVTAQEINRGRRKGSVLPVENKHVKLAEKTRVKTETTLMDTAGINQERLNIEELKQEKDKKEIAAIMKGFPGLTRYYEFIERAGRGTFSKVYKAKDLLANEYMPISHDLNLGGSEDNFVAIKLIFDISTPLRVANEIRFLSMLRSSPCITPLITAFRHEPYTYVVLPYIGFDHFDEFFLDMTMSDIKSYISQLLIGLNCAHKKGIMHRDVKPGNFLYNNKTKVGYLADFGLAQIETQYKREGSGLLPNPHYTHLRNEAGHYIHDRRPPFQGGRSGTKGFRAPEVILKYLNQTTAIDIWAVGVLLLIILSGRYPFFNPEDDSEAIMELAHLFGMKNLREFIQHYGRSIQTNIPTIPEEEMDIELLCREMNKENIEKWDNTEFLQAIDLLKHCLVLIHTKRYSATEALNHPFFKP